MENASEALIMAASVIIFVVALSVSVYAFGEARIAADIVMQGSDATFDQTYIDADKKGLLRSVTFSDSGITVGDSSTSTNNSTSIVTRTVGAETIIPTLYRAYKEKIIIVFAEGSQSNCFKNGIFAQKVTTDANPYSHWNSEDGITRDNKTINLEKLNLGDGRTTEFITYLLKSTKNDDFLQNKFMIDKNGIAGTQNFKSLMDTSLYDVITTHTFNELVGSYYQKDVLSQDEDDDSSSQTSNVNEPKTRIITYVLNN